MIFSRDIGIDLGTSTTLVADRKGNIIMKEPSVVAVDVKSKRVLATGDEAKGMIGRTPGSIVPVMPIRSGVIADFDMTSDMLRSFISRAGKNGIVTKTRVVISVPSGVTEVERRAVEDAVRSAGAQEVELIEAPMAAALGAGLPVYEATGSMIIDIGGGTCDVAVVSLGGIASVNSIRVGGESMDEAIVEYMKKEHSLLIGERTAEDIKIKIGSAAEYDGEAVMEIKGRSLEDGLPASAEISSADIRGVLSVPVNAIIGTVKQTLEVTLPELAADIMDRGVYLTGGASRLKGLKDRLESEIKIPVIVPESPEECVVKGTSVKLRRAK
ncbi:MAG: rod shape-determining protein [Eubacterium sp.]|nr:rod shape-determining protein [Eubacterium sp.]